MKEDSCQSQVITRFKSVLPIMLLMLITILFMLPLIKSFSQWGWRDWDGFAFWNYIQRVTLLSFKQIPLWNPYGNGGTVMLAHPHSSFLSPFFIFVLFLGPYTGVKVQMILHLFIGLLGMYHVALSFDIKRLSACLSAVVFMLSSVYAAHMTVGHASWMPLAYMPWLFLFFCKSIRTMKYLIAAILTYSLMFLSGSVDVLHISTTFLCIYALFLSIQKKSIRPIAMYGIIVLGSMLLCAIKLMPMVEFLIAQPRPTLETDGTSFSVLCRMLFSRVQGIYERSNTLYHYGWHEYAAYIGLYSLGLAGCGLAFKVRRHWPLFANGVICLFIAMGSRAPINIWHLLHSLPGYNSQHVPSRYIVGLVFCIALFSGLGYSFFENCVSEVKRKGIRVILQILLIVGVGLIACDLIAVNSPILKDACKREPGYLPRHETFQQRYRDSTRTNYPIAASNSGVLNSYEVIAVNPGPVKIIDDLDYRGEVYLLDNNGIATIEKFSPNEISINVTADSNDIVVVNQNVCNGWYVKVNENPSKKVEGINVLLEADVMPGASKVVFYYLPISFIIGSIISVISACILMCIVLKLAVRNRNE